ncbi:MAG: response regulator [Bacteroidia bacterium]|nr:MAG: response regulator [Bacteroidia bacterium]
MTTSDPIYSILYIDDEENNLISFKSTFRRDYRIHVAGTGKAGLEIMEKNTIQLVITDQKMPDMSGIEFLEKIVPLYPDCMRMIMTGFSDMDAIIQAINKGNIYRYVSKPWNREELKIIIDSALEVYNLKSQNKHLIEDLKEANQNLERKVMERTRQIEQQRLNITDSIHYASRIQKALMLPSEELEKIIPSHFVLNKPKDIVSGDYYWVSKKNNKLILTVADCTGHGVPGAFMSIMGINFLNEIVNNSEIPRANEILNELRDHLIKSLGQTGQRDEAKDGMEMALCVVDIDKKQIQFSGAFRPMYLVCEGELKVINGDRMPIGIYNDELLPFTNKELAFKDNDIIYLFTDGYVDQIGGPHRKTFKSKQFKELLKEIHHKPLKEQRSILREEIEIWRSGQEQIDDIMILGVQLSFSQSE